MSAHPKGHRSHVPSRDRTGRFAASKKDVLVAEASRLEAALASANPGAPEHRWSGWPGAFCLDCGAEDQREYCVAVHDAGLRCWKCGRIRPNDVCDPPDAEHHGPLAPCAEHQNKPCPRGTRRIPGAEGERAAD